ncbi:hypothetical protein H2203_003295 [Taxawa tesnikishii (nom. ined.)]|nr:hypothetical protein H2203_003295 [Dothideales sp. JES 119]
MGDSPPDSPLSSLASDDDYNEGISTPNRSSRPSIDTHASHDPDSLMPPSKRRRTGGGFSTFSANERATPLQTQDHDSDVDLSEDTEGSAPGSPSHDEYALRADQITTCQWEGCPVGDLGNSDDLIKHVQIEHISPKRRGKLTTRGCAQNATAPLHAPTPSQNTCAQYTNPSPSDVRNQRQPDRCGNGPTKERSQDPADEWERRRWLRLKDTATDGAVFDLSHDNDNIVYLSAYHPITGQPGFMITYPPDIAFSQFESEIPADQLMRLLRRQLHWAQQESEELKAEIEMLEGIRREEWIKKDLLLDNVRDAELAVGKARGYVQDGLANDMERDIETAKGLKWSGEEPWWRKGDDGADEGGDADVEGEASRAGSAAYAGLPIGFDRARARNEDSMSEDEDGEDEELEQREDSADRRMDTTEDGGEQSARAERDDDMMAVGALMGLSAGKTDGG